MLVYFAVILTVLLGFCGLAIDVGRVELRTLQLQGAVDDAAVSTAAEWQQGNSNWRDAAPTEAAAYLLANHLPAASVDAPVMTAGVGPYAGDASVVQVTLHQTMPTTFLGLITHGSTPVALTVTALARVPACAYLLASPAINHGASDDGYGLQLAGTTLTTSCPVWTLTGMLVDGGSRIVGSGSGSLAASGTSDASQMMGSVSQAVSYRSPRQNDPLAYLQGPALVHCDHTNASYSSTVTLSPGSWCGGLNASGATLNLLPGMYVISGGANWSNTTINGTGVTLYFTQGGGSGFGTFSLNHQSTMRLSAPVDGSNGGLPGVLLFADRAWSGSDEDILCSNSTVLGDGVFYTAGTGMNVTQCNLSGPDYFSVVAANLSAVGSTVTFHANFDTLAGGSPLHNNVSLVQ